MPPPNENAKEEEISDGKRIQEGKCGFNQGGVD